jgi:hypothetical protein
MAYDPLQVALYYAALFPARSDVYSAWTGDGWRPVREPLTPEIVIAGLTGKGPSISGYMIAPGSVSHVLAYDFDTDDGLEQAFQLALFMRSEGLPAYVETSRRGAHLWVLLDKVLPAVAIRMAARGLLQGAGLPDDDPHIEIRPGTDRVDAEWHEHVRDAVVGTGLGHALRLPLMPHPKTGRAGRLMYPSGETVRGTLAEILLALDTADTTKLMVWAERWKRPPVTSLPSSHRNPHERTADDDASASELLRTLWGALDAVPGKVIACPAKAYHVHGDIHKGCRVFPDDRRVMCHKTGCILNNDGKGRGTWELRKLAPGE